MPVAKDPEFIEKLKAIYAQNPLAWDKANLSMERAVERAIRDEKWWRGFRAFQRLYGSRENGSLFTKTP